MSAEHHGGHKDHEEKNAAGFLGLNVLATVHADSKHRFVKVVEETASDGHYHRSVDYEQRQIQESLDEPIQADEYHGPNHS